MRLPTNPCGFRKACNILYYYHIVGLNQTQTSIESKVNIGTVNHVIRRRRYKRAYPVAPS
jgi:hypothetical protein